MAFAYVLLPCVLWSATGTVVTFLPSAVEPIAIGAWQQGVGGLLYFLVHASSSWQALRARGTRRWVLVGAISIAASVLVYFPSLALGGIALGATVVFGSAPVFAGLIEWVVDGVRPAWRWASGTALAIVGIALVAFGSAPAIGPASAFDVTIALLLGLVSGLGYAVYAYASRRAIRAGATSSGAMGGMFLVCSVLLIPVVLATGLPLVQSWAAVGIAAYLAIVPLFFGYLLFARGLALVSASSALTVTLAQPAIAALLAVIIVGERVSAVGWFGIAVIAGGILIASLPARSRPDAGAGDAPEGLPAARESVTERAQE